MQPAHTKTKSVCTRLQAAPTCLQHCQEMMRRSSIIVWCISASCRKYILVFEMETKRKQKCNISDIFTIIIWLIISRSSNGAPSIWTLRATAHLITGSQHTHAGIVRDDQELFHQIIDCITYSYTQHNVLFFVVFQIALNVFQRVSGVDEPLMSLALHSLVASVKMRPWDMSAEASLGSVSIQHKQYKGK